MAWPLSQDYNEAIQDAQSCFTDPELRAGEATCNAMGMPMPRSGNFADVYEFNTPTTKSKWAIKCFTRHVPGLRERYTEISSGLLGAKLPFAVDFQYLVQGIRVRGDWFPILKMRWVEGQLLNELVRDNLDKPALLGQLGLIWGRMAKRLREAGIAHADLQHGNVILVPGSKSGSVAVKLIDYDGMFVPALASKKSGEVGHPNYQHPQRLREGIYNAEVDRFPLLVVATALHALSVGGRELWDRYDNSDNLLFRESDLQAPGKSALFKELHNLADPQARMLAEELHKAAEGDLTKVPLIDDLLPETKTTKTVSTLAPGKPPTPKSAGEDKAAEITAPPNADAATRTEPKRKSAEKSGGMPKWVWIAGGGAVAASFVTVIGIAVATMAFTGGDGKKAVALNKGEGNTDKKKTLTKNVTITGKDKTRIDEVGNTEKKKLLTKDVADPDKDKTPVVPAAAKRFPATVPTDNGSKWRVDGDDLVQDALVRDASIFFGDPKWTDYDFSVEAKRIEGPEGFSLWFRHVDTSNGYVFNLGNFSNTWHMVESWEDGKYIHPQPAARQIENEPLKKETWYSARVSVRGDKGSCFLDGVKVFDFKIDRASGGLVGLRTWETACRFKNIKVTAPDGTVLLEGLPDVAPVPPVVAEGFVPLFNGKDLTGWKAHAQLTGNWRVVNEVLTGSSPTDGFLYTQRDDFKDFHLRVEARYLESKKVGGGISCRASFDFAGYEAMIHDPEKKTGSLSVTAQGRKNQVGSRLAAAVPSGDWFTMEVVAEGNRLTVKVNGKTTTELVDKQNQFTRGHIALSQYGTSTLELRKIEIKELNVGAVPPPVFAVEGLVPLFNGKDFTGWNARPDMTEWSIVSDILVSSGEKNHFLGSTDLFENAHLRLEARINEGGAANVIVRGMPNLHSRGYLVSIEGRQNRPATGSVVGRRPEGPGAAFGSQVAGQNLVKPGKWFTMDVVFVDNRMMVSIDQVLVTEFTDPERIHMRGRISLFHPGAGTTVEFRKVEIKKLPGSKKADPVLLDIAGELKADDPKDTKNQNSPCRRFPIKLTAGKTYQIDLKSKDFDSYLRLMDSTNKEIAFDDDSGGFPDARIIVTAVNGGDHTIVVTSFDRKVGKFNLNAVELDASKTPVSPVSPMKTKDPPVNVIRVAVPDAEKVTQSEKDIREQFKKEYAKKTSAELVALAEKLLQLSKETTDNPIDCYALLRESRSLATKAGAVELALKSAAEMIGKYEVDELTTKVDTLVGLSKAALNAETTKQFVEAALVHAATALVDDHFDAAAKIVAAAEAALTRNKNGALLAQVQKQDKQIKETAKEHGEMKKAQEKLLEDAKDPGANLIVGSYLAFRKRDWDKGLPLLALGSLAELQELAKKDLAAPEDAKARAELGDAWWNGADKKPAHQKLAMHWRAAHWYRQALPSLTGLAQTRATDRVKQVDAQPKQRNESFVAGSVWSGTMVFLNGGKLKAPANRPFNINISFVSVKNGVFEGEYVAPAPPPENEVAIKVRGQYNASGNFTMRFVEVTRGNKKTFAPMVSQGFAAGAITGETIRAQYTEAMNGLIGQIEIKLERKK